MTEEERQALEKRVSTMAATHSLELTPAQRKSRFLEAFRICGNMTASADFASTSKDTIREYRRKDPEFKALYEEALQASIDRLEEEGRRRAYYGVEEPVLFQGQPTYKRDWLGEIVRDKNGDPVIFTVRKPSDRLMELFLKAKSPQFKEHVKHEHEVRGGVLVVGAPAATPADWEKQVANQQAEHRGQLASPEAIVDAVFEEVLPKSTAKSKTEDLDDW